MLSQLLFVSLLLVPVLTCFTVIPNSYGWGKRGHRIVATIAESRLTPAARTKINKLLNGAHLADVATWADDIREQRKNTAPWHFVDIPKSVKNYNANRDCKDGNCVIEAIRHFSAQLSSTSLTGSQRAEALKFLVHFYGDLHQPFHCIDNNDRGGNEVSVRILDKSSKGRKSNLHSVWDVAIIDYTKETDNDLVAELNGWLHDQGEAQYLKGGLVNWSESAHAIAQSEYVENGATIDKGYLNRAVPVVKKQLAIAGLRLADELNRLLKGEI